MTGYELIWTLYFCYTVWFLYTTEKQYHDNILDLFSCILEWQDEVVEQEEMYQTAIILLQLELEEKEEQLKLMERLP